jgi:flavin-dependent dehydrogenase
MTIQSPDVLVIGAGTAGAAAAARLAEGGCSVVLADRRPAEEAGACWINAIPGWLFDEAALARPEPPERVRAAEIHASVLADGHGRVCTVVESDPGLHVDMGSLTRRLQQRARDAGVDFLQGRVTGIEMANGRLVAVTLATAKATAKVRDRDHVTIRPRLTVDASGAAATLRRRVPALADACPAPLPRDICLAAQYQHRITDPAGAKAFLEAHKAAPGDNVTRMGVVGGYSILMVNVSEDLTEAGILSGAIPADGVPSGQAIVDRFVARAPWLGQRLAGGRAPIPLGQPCTRLAAPGVALVGNAANQVYALHGSGVGMGLIAARLLADAATAGGDPGDAAALHRYAHRFLRTYGGRLAASDLFRRHSQTLTRDEISALLRSGMVGGPMLAAGLGQTPFEVDPHSLRTLLGGALRHPRLALRLAPLALRLAPLALRLLRLQATFDDYPDQPDPHALQAFDARLSRIRGF